VGFLFIVGCLNGAMMAVIVANSVFSGFLMAEFLPQYSFFSFSLLSAYVVVSFLACRP